MRRAEDYWRRVIHGRGGVPSILLRGLLWIVSLLYGGVTFIRNNFYDRGWFFSDRPKKESSLIISVGNLTVGGAGKTPLILKLAQQLKQEASLAILSRGYRSRAEKSIQPLVMRSGSLLAASLCGDESLLLAHRLPHASIYIGRDRCRSAHLAVEQDAILLLVDDGLQHRRLKRDFDLVLIDADDPLGGGYLFPRGVLREYMCGLRRASLLIINHVRDAVHFQHVADMLSRYSSSPCVGTRLQVSRVIDRKGEEVSSLRGVKVGIFCGTAYPTRFAKTISELGADCVGQLFSSDHCLPDPQLLKKFAHDCKAKGGDWLLCTEKDWVKLDAIFLSKLALPVAHVDVDLQIIAGDLAWSQFLEEVRSRIRSIRSFHHSDRGSLSV